MITVRVTSEIDITTMGKAVSRIVQQVEISTQRGPVSLLAWSPLALAEAYTTGRLELVEFEALTEYQLNHPTLAALVVQLDAPGARAPTPILQLAEDEEVTTTT